MKILGWFSLIFFVVGLIAIVNGLKNQDTWILCLGTVLFAGSNFFEIIINRHMIRNLNQERKT